MTLSSLFSLGSINFWDTVTFWMCFGREFLFSTKSFLYPLADLKKKLTYMLGIPDSVHGRKIHFFLGKSSILPFTRISLTHKWKYGKNQKILMFLMWVVPKPPRFWESEKRYLDSSNLNFHQNPSDKSFQVVHDEVWNAIWPSSLNKYCQISVFLPWSLFIVESWPRIVKAEKTVTVSARSTVVPYWHLLAHCYCSLLEVYQGAFWTDKALLRFVRLKSRRLSRSNQRVVFWECGWRVEGLERMVCAVEPQEKR